LPALHGIRGSRDAPALVQGSQTAP
jgi:hypothetical protein